MLYEQMAHRGALSVESLHGSDGGSSGSTTPTDEERALLVDGKRALVARAPASRTLDMSAPGGDDILLAPSLHEQCRSSVDVMWQAAAVRRAMQRAAAAAIVAAARGHRARAVARALRTLRDARTTLCGELALEASLLNCRAAALLASMHRSHGRVRKQLLQSLPVALALPIALREAELSRRTALLPRPHRRFRLPRNASIAEEGSVAFATQRLAAAALRCTLALGALAGRASAAASGAAGALAAATAQAAARQIVPLVRMAGAEGALCARRRQLARAAAARAPTAVGRPLRAELGAPIGSEQATDAGLACAVFYHDCGGVRALYPGGARGAGSEVVVLGGRHGGRNQHCVLERYF